MLDVASAHEAHECGHAVLDERRDPEHLPAIDRFGMLESERLGRGTGGDDLGDLLDVDAGFARAARITDWSEMSRPSS